MPCRLLRNASKAAATRRWAVDGLSYLTLDADVKEDLVQDVAALGALLLFAHTHPALVAYSTALVLVNLTNSYDKKVYGAPKMTQLINIANKYR